MIVEICKFKKEKTFSSIPTEKFFSSAAGQETIYFFKDGLTSVIATNKAGTLPLR
jgi:hypothetical protein